MKKAQRLLSMALVFFLIFSLGVMAVDAKGPQGKGPKHDRDAFEVKFKDADEAAWAAEYIDSMQAKNVFSGYEDGTFRPNKPVTRLEAVVMAVRLMGLDEEAQKKDTSTQLHFKDAKQIDKKSWAKGYVLVALENGLFDASEDQLQPDKPASRVWVSSLLVRALGLQDEALEQMTVTPDFKDVKSIPAGSIGYVNVAVEYDIVTGYPNGTFQPNKPVTRAEMAALLERTNDDLLDKIGAYTVSGVVTDISFSDRPVSGDVYNGEITIKNFSDNKLLTYDISSDLLIKYEDKYITADQLLVDDAVVLVVKDGVVREGAIVDPEAIEELNIVELKIEAEFFDGKAEYEYKNKRGEIEAKIEVEDRDNKEEIKGDRAVAFMEDLIAELDITSATDKEEILDRVLAALFEAEDLENLKELEIKVNFSDGKYVKIEKEDFDVEEGITELKIKTELTEDRKAEFTYKNDRDKAEAYVKFEDNTGKEELKGEEALEYMEELIVELDITSESNKEEIREEVVAALFGSEELADLLELEIEVKFSNGEEVEIEWTNDDVEVEDISKLKITAELTEDRKAEFSYYTNRGRTEAYVKFEEGRKKEELKGEEAQALMEELIAELDITSESDEREVFEQVLSALFNDEDVAELKQLDIEVEFSNGEEVEVEWENEDLEDDDDDDDDDDDRRGNGRD